MQLKYAVAGLIALGGIAMSAGSASAMPNGLNSGIVVDRTATTEQVRLVCDRYGRCFRTPGHGPRYGYGGGGYGPRHGYGGGRGYGPRHGYRGGHRGHGHGRW